MEIVKRVVTAALLLFVAASVGTLVFQEIAQPPQAPGNDAPEGAATQPAAEEGAADSDAPPESAESSEAHIMAYYFHNTRRCTTCLKIEEAAEAALRQTYVEELEN